MPMNMKMNFQESNSIFSEKMINLHDHMISLMTLIMTSILYWTLISMTSKMMSTKEADSNETEMFWTSIPMILLIYMSIPSIMILYLSEEMINPSMTMKIQGNQWYWEYEYPNLNSNSKMSSYIEKSNTNRLMKTNNILVIPTNVNMRLLVTSNDVIHSWTMPSIFLKTDAIPGRMNQTTLNINKTSMLFGQCSEICGMNHSFMPIMIMSK